MVRTRARRPACAIALIVAFSFIHSTMACSTHDVVLAHGPTALAGWDRDAEIGREVVLDGSRSFDPDGDILDFMWTVESVPTGAVVSIERPRAKVTRIVPDAEGTIVVSLTVADRELADRDLVAITARPSRSADVLEANPSPRVCAADFDAISTSACGSPDGRIRIDAQANISHEIDPAPAIEWTFLRLPPTVVADDLDADADTPLLEFTPTRPGDYWVGARLVGAHTASALSLSAISVLGELPRSSDRATASLRAPARTRVGNRVLFDGRESRLPDGSPDRTIRREWQIWADPSAGRDRLVDTATGCAVDACRVLVPTTAGTYIVSHTLVVDEVPGATAIHAVLVSES